MKTFLILRKVLLITLSIMALTRSGNLNAQGPNAPEAASFEPVDATDMVNLATGDFTYVLPLLNIPSPQGGYPITLSYHAGIAMEQEASWSGLGWNINPGAINRSLNGYPDDWKDSQMVSMIFNVGGEVKTNTLQFGVGWGEGKYSIGVYQSWGENRSFGGETQYFSQYGLNASISGSGSTKNWNTGYSGSYSASLNISSGGVGLNLYAGAEQKSKSNSPTGMSLESIVRSKASSNAISKSKSNSSGLNGQSFKASDNFSANVGFGIGNLRLQLNYSKQKIRYWNYDKKRYYAVGVLYAGEMENVFSQNPIRAIQDFDSYSVNNNIDKERGQLENNLSSVSYDNYSVSAQGFTASISPKLMEMASLYSSFENIKLNGEANKHQIFSHNLNNFSKSLSNNLNFYVDNEYSSFMDVNSSSIPQPISTYSSIDDLLYSMPLTSNFNTVLNLNDQNLDNYNANNERITKSTFIETFTNGEILSNNMLGFNGVLQYRNDYDEDGIGGFRITTQDGKTYYYAIPVYQKEKFSRTSNINENIDLRFFEKSSLDFYATHWLLTAVTGPDYVDVNSNNLIDQEDYGYWVNFDYGKWSDGYTWRTPRINYETTDTNKTFEWGNKEIYYLDRIITKTHTALFVKDLRRDNISNEIKIGTSRANPKKYEQFVNGWNSSAYSLFKGTDNNYYTSGTYQNYSLGYPLDLYDLFYTDFLTEDFFFVKTEVQSLMKLKQILLFNNKDIPSSFTKNNGNNPILGGEIYIKERARLQQYGDLKYDNTEEIIDKTWIGQDYKSILDPSDLSGLNMTKALRVIDLNYDYSLYSNSPNSNSSGKLTLKDVVFKGKGGSQNVPPYKFTYFDNAMYDKDNTGDWGYTKSHPNNGSLSTIVTPVGGKIKIEYEPDDFYKEAVSSKRIVRNGVKFTFSNFSSSYMKIIIENDEHATISQNINFSDYFSVNNYANIDLWTCYRHDYRDPTCKSRKGVVDIPFENNTQILSVSENQLALLIPYSGFTTNNNGGLDWLKDRTPVSKDYHPNMFLDDLGRGGCGNPTNCDGTDRLVLDYKIEFNDLKTNLNGGGLRVKSISMEDNGVEVSKSSYYYNSKGFEMDPSHSDYRSSGVTSYAPSKFEKHILYINELPRPSVIYKNVKVVDKLSNYNTYEFQTLEYSTGDEYDFSIGDALNIKILDDNNYQSNFIGQQQGPSTINTRRYIVNKNFTSLGRLVELNSFNSKHQLLSKTNNIYNSQQDIRPGNVQETFNKYIFEKDNELQINKFRINTTSISTKVTALESTTTTQGGYTNTTYFDKYDFNTGQVLETIREDSKGNRFKTELVPAYTIPEYNPSTGYGMGSKVDDITNKNMLSQEAMTKTYMEVGGEWEETGVGITTWNNNWVYVKNDLSPPDPVQVDEKIWRKHKSFVWDGELNANGTYQDEEFDGADDNFEWGIAVAGSETVQTDSDWKNVSTTTQYDHYSMPEEVRDLNNNYTSTKMDKNHEKIFSTSNAAYSEQFFSGAEEVTNGWVGGQISIGSHVDTFAHTGQYSESAGVNSQNFKCFPKPKFNANQSNVENYHISVWVHKDNDTPNDVYQNARLYNGASLVEFTGETVFAGDWVQLNHYLDLSAETEIYVTSDSGTLYFDDFRIHPTASSMTSYVYNEWDELSYILGSDNLATHFKYDEAGRLKETYSEVVDFDGPGSGGIKLVKDYEYNYALNHTEGAAFSASINWTNPMTPLQTGNYLYNELVVNNGSGDYTYTWEFKKGSTVLSSGSNNYAIVYVGSNESGTTTLNFNVTDNTTGETINVSRTFYALDSNGQGINFANIQEDIVTNYEIYTTATLSVPRTDTLKFWAMNRSATGNNAVITIKRGTTTLYSHTFGYYENATIEVPASSGDNLTIKISIPNTNATPFYVVDFRIQNSVNGEVYPVDPREINIDYQN